MPKFDIVTVVSDVAGTHTYTPSSNQGGLSSWINYAAATPTLQSKLTVSVAQPSKTSKLYKARIKLVVPVPKKDLNGAVTGLVDHVNSVDMTFLSSEASTILERSNLLELATALLNTQLILDVVPEARSIY